MSRYPRRSIDLTDEDDNRWRVTVSTAGALVVTDMNLPATKALLKFTPESDGTDAFDYSGGGAITFTINDGAGATTVTLDADGVNLAGVVALVDADLGARYVVSADGAQVKIEAATAGAKTFVVGGTDAAAITGSANYVNTPGTDAT